MEDYTVPAMFSTESTKETATFLFQQAEKRLIETLETDKLLSDRCYRSLAVLIPAFTAILTILINRASEKGDFLFYLLLVTMVFVFAAIRKIYSIIKPKQIHPNGSDPIISLNENALRLYAEYEPEKSKKIEKGELEELRREKQVIGFILWEIQNYQSRIDHNRNENEKRFKVFNSALNTLNLMVWVDLALVIPYLLAVMMTVSRP